MKGRNEMTPTRMQTGDTTAATSVSDSGVTRRGFCNRLLMTSAAIVVAANCESSVAASASPSAYPVIKIDGAAAMVPGSFLLFNYPSRNDPAILVRTADGSFYAHGRKCSHFGCSVDFNPEHDCLECPCHMGAYDMRSGLVLQGPPRRPLDRVFLEVRGGEVWAVGRTNSHDAVVNIAS